jgi:hypothetical protein
MLFGVTMLDAISYAGAIVLIVIVVMFASFIPAARQPSKRSSCGAVIGDIFPARSLAVRARQHSSSAQLA